VNLVCKSKANCGQTRHSIEDCFQVSGGKQGQYPPCWRGKQSIPTIANFTTASDGGIISRTHYALSASINSSDVNALIKENVDSLKRVALAAGNMPTLSSFFADSGYTIHFFKNREVFSLYKLLNKVEDQSSKERTSFTILGSGNIEFKAVFKGGEHTLMFHNATHASNITANLLSISRIDQAGWSIEFGRGCVQFFNKYKIEVFGKILKNRLYLIHGLFSTKVLTTLTAHSLQNPTDIDTWHCHFSHFGVSRVQEASKLVDGLEIVKNERVGHCKDYILANMKCCPSNNEVVPERMALQ
jgi:hypothetical protein